MEGSTSYEILFETALTFTSSLVLLLIAWVVGQRLTVKWNISQKRKENKLESAREFHKSYGEFFALWKLWNNHCKFGNVPDELYNSLFERACTSEGKMESLLVRICTENLLNDYELNLLGRFRQHYQVLRERIRDRKPLEWAGSHHPDYLDFKKCAVAVSILIGSDGKPPSAEEGADALLKITSNEHELRTRAAF